MTGAPEIPERLQARVVALVADALPAVSPLPAPLRRIAAFAPARRARTGGRAIWEALADEDFRGHAATQVAGREPDLAGAGDPLDRGAWAWLSREPGWEDALAEVVAHLESDRVDLAYDRAEVDRLRHQVASLEEELRTARTEAKARLDEAKAEHDVLRRRLGEARAAARTAERALDEAVAGREEDAREAAQVVARAESEARRLRNQLDEATASMSTARRETRTERDAASVRARYLLDTVVEAAAGLRRELALPPVTTTPGEAVEAELIGVEPARTTSAPAGPAVLEQLLSMPRARLLVDGYNVSKEAWPASSLEAQRSRLLTALAPLVARTGAETTVVFDAASSGARPVVPAPRGVKVVFSPAGVIADDVIRSLVDAEPAGRVVVVVSSDREVARDVARSGARALPSASLLGLISVR